MDLGFPLRALVLPAEDAPQYANLPDLGPALRACLVGKRWTGSFLAHCLHSCLPIPKSTQKQPAPDLESCWLLFNVLLATLLGLYPAAVKRPPFSVRCLLFARVHALLTAPSDTQARFARAHADLLAFCLAEYVCRLLPALMPAEREAMCSAQAVEGFFQAGPQLFEAFRQEALDTGEETWASIAAAAREGHEKLCRTYRSKCRLPQQPRRAQPSDAPQDVLRAAMSCHRIVRYPCHRAQEGLLADEYATLLGSRELADAAVVHSLVKIAELPGSVTEAQVRLGRQLTSRWTGTTQCSSPQTCSGPPCSCGNTGS